MTWAGIFLPRVIPAAGGGDNVDVELPQGIKELRITAYNATAVRGTIAIYFLMHNMSHLIGASTPGVVLDPLQVTHPGRIPRGAKVRVTFANTVALDELHVNVSYEVEE